LWKFGPTAQPATAAAVASAKVTQESGFAAIDDDLNMRQQVDDFGIEATGGDSALCGYRRGTVNPHRASSQ
jgi:hypothetical protein